MSSDKNDDQLMVSNTKKVHYLSVPERSEGTEVSKIAVRNCRISVSRSDAKKCFGVAVLTQNCFGVAGMRP